MEMKRLSRLGSRIAVAVVSMVMALTMAPLAQGGFAYADETGVPAITVGSDILANGANTSNAPTVRYGSAQNTSKSWQVVDYDARGSEVLGRSGSVTMLLKGTANAITFSNANNWFNYQYGTSNYKDYLESWLPGGSRAAFSSTEKDYLTPRTLEGGGGELNTAAYDENKIAGSTVSNAYIWPLSVAEARAVNETLRKANSSWWLRTPGAKDGSIINVATVNGWNATVNVSGARPDEMVTYDVPIISARPVIGVDKNAILLTSAATGGKVSGTTGTDSLQEVGTNTSGEWKLTLHDETKDDFRVALAEGGDLEITEGYEDCDIPIIYSKSDTADNNYVSVLLCDADDKALYYGHISEETASGEGYIGIPEGLSVGYYTLYVFNEECNGDGKTDYSSVFSSFELKVFAGDAWEKTDSLPTKSGSYFLKSDVTTDWTVPAGADITIDLNGNTITGQITVGGGSEATKLTIMDSRTGGKVTDPDHDVIVVGNNGTFILESGQIDASGDAYNAIHIENGGQVTVNGGKVTSGNSAVGLMGGSFTINDGEVSGNGKGIDSHTGTITVNGGEITAAGNGSSGIYALGSTVSVTGGTVTGGKASVDLNMGDLSISGGYIHGAVTAQDGSTSSITGGFYTDRPADSLLESGYSVMGNDDSTYKYKIIRNVASIELNKTEMGLLDGKSYKLIPTVLPEDAYNKNVTWTSSDETVATVSEDGTVYGVYEGTAVITATTEDGGLTASCTVTVSSSHDVWWKVEDNVLHLRNGMAEGYSSFTEEEQKVNRSNGPWGTAFTEVIVDNVIYPVDMNHWFAGAESFTKFTNPEKIDTSSVTTMYCTFYECKALTHLDINMWDTSNVTNMSHLFYRCYKLGEDEGTIDLQGWDTSQVKDTSCMFCDCDALKTLDLSTWNTSNVTNMDTMFGWCDVLEGIDFTGFDTSSVTTTYQMFCSCPALKTLDLSCFNMSKVTDKSIMFGWCGSLETIYVSENSGWSSQGSNVFSGCDKLVGQNGTTLASGGTGGTYARLDGGPDSDTPGYFTGIFIITFEDGLGNVIGDPQRLTYGETITVPADPIRDGYRFEGWDQEFDVAKKDTTIKATWIKCITVTFDANGGNGTMEQVDTVEGNYALPNCGFSHPGYLFQGWKLGKIIYAAEDDGTMDVEVSLEEDVTFKAMWIRCDHKWSEWTMTTEPTCDAEGEQARECALCHDSEIEVIPALGHAWGDWAKLDDDQHQRVCANDTSHTEKADHTWDEGIVTKEPTTETEGEKTFTCTDCGAAKTEPIDKIVPSSIEKAKVSLSYTAYTYNGKARKPAVTVVLGGTKLVEDTDYTVAYASGCKNVGQYKVTVKGKGGYTGSKAVTFRINPKGTSLQNPVKASKAVTVKWKGQSAKMATSRITGYQIQLATNSKFTKNLKTVKVKGYSNTYKKVKSLKGGTKYYIRIRTYKTVGGKAYYSGWSKVKTVTTLK